MKVPCDLYKDFFFGEGWGENAAQVVIFEEMFFLCEFTHDILDYKVHQVAELIAKPYRDKDYHIGSNFWKFSLIRTGFKLGELVSFDESV